jgi:benzoyl-CoA reductase/2-hydroxyglutaryl-CoA dehydratase subunit BcrC/BadD/HgdB
VLWDAIPIWPRRRWLAEQCAARGIAVVASTYTHSWWFDLDPHRAWDALVERYAWNTMNRDAGWVLDWTLGLVRDYGCHGILAHWNASCGIWNSYVKRRLPGFAAAGVPCAVIRADMVDAQAFAADAVSAVLDDLLARMTAVEGRS